MPPPEIQVPKIVERLRSTSKYAVMSCTARNQTVPGGKLREPRPLTPRQQSETEPRSAPRARAGPRRISAPEWRRFFRFRAANPNSYVSSYFAAVAAGYGLKL